MAHSNYLVVPFYCCCCCCFLFNEERQKINKIVPPKRFVSSEVIRWNRKTLEVLRFFWPDYLGKSQRLLCYVFALSARALLLASLRNMFSLPNTLRRMCTNSLCSLPEEKQSSFLRVQVHSLDERLGSCTQQYPLAFDPSGFPGCKFPSKPQSLDSLSARMSQDWHLQVSSPWCFSLTSHFASRLRLAYFSLIFWSVRTCLWLWTDS